MAIAFLATIAAQMGSAWINSSRSKAHSQKMADLQRAYEEKAAIEGIENARAEFAELCSFQREMEQQTHHDRLELIRKNHESTINQIAYEKSLHKWPLLVPPYVIANAPLTLNASTNQSIPLNCILTTSANLNFNRHVFPNIEEQIALFCSKYWNISASKSIRFFQEAWKDRASDLGSLHKDIYAHLKNVPTLLISPVLKNNTILFRFYWWGLSLDPSDAHVDELNELNPELSISITTDMKFDGDISNLIVSECVPKLEAFISFFADMYYWNFYKSAPSLPLLLHSDVISLSNVARKDYYKEYEHQLYSTLNNHSALRNLSSIYQGFSPSIEDEANGIRKITQYYLSLPDAKQIEEIDLIENILINTNGVQNQEIRKIEQRVTKLSENICKSPNWTIVQADALTMNHIFTECGRALNVLPSCEYFNIIIKPEKLCVIAYFTKGNEVVSWDNYGIWVFQCTKFLSRKNYFANDRFICHIDSFYSEQNKIKEQMTTNEINAILEGQYDKLKQELRPLASKIDDLFKSYIDKVKATIAQECSSKEIDTFNKKEVSYEDLIKWLRKAKTLMQNQPFNGAFLTKGNGGFFDKYPYKLYICLTRDKSPLADEQFPRCVITYASMDDTLEDLFGKNSSVQLNFN